MASTDIPQFGEPPEGEAAPDRPAAFVVVERDGLLAIVRVPGSSGGLVLDLPGGGLDPGETEAQAAIRECGEEAGLRVELDAEPFGRADHFLYRGQVVRNTRGVFFAGHMIAEDLALKIEDDHELLWLEPERAIAELDRPSHGWAVKQWLALRARG